MSEPTTHRRSTVHDFSTLRLHPDGTRVPISSPSQDTINNSRTRNTGRDIRGNRVARDAAGLGVVPKRAVMREDDNDEVQNTKPRVPRHGKRRRMDDHVEFLGDAGGGVRRACGDTTDANREAMKWPVPSSDLLKCVHYFASQYYAARGLLSDRPRKYRREVRQRKAGHALAAVGGAGEAGADGNGDVLFTEGWEDHEDYSGKDDPCEGGVAKNRGWDEERGVPSESVPDMYRALDGSALMAIGMLLQEHISTLLKPNIPLGWEEEMETAGLPLRKHFLGHRKATDDVESQKADDEEVSLVSDLGDRY